MLIQFCQEKELLWILSYLLFHCQGYTILILIPDEEQAGIFLKRMQPMRQGTNEASGVSCIGILCFFVHELKLWNKLTA